MLVSVSPVKDARHPRPLPRITTTAHDCVAQVNSSFKLSRIVSGGQTGVDRAALDVAIYLAIPHGGWCPQGRIAEDGTIPETYQLKETDSQNYRVRTEKNVIDSDGTLILYRAKMSKGTALTRRLADSYRRPLFCLDLEKIEDMAEEELGQVIESVHHWVAEHNIAVLNIAGPRESSCDGVGKLAEQFLVRLLQQD